MLKKLVLGGVAVATFASLGLSTPAGAVTAPPPSDSAAKRTTAERSAADSATTERDATGWDELNDAEQNDNVIVCGNHLIGNIFILLAPLAPSAFADRAPVDCSIVVKQEN